MKRAFVGSLTAVLLSAGMAPVAMAETVTEVDSSFPAAAESVRMDVTPFNLVFLAYQGFFESEGVPMASALISWYESGRIEAEDLVNIAIGMNRLSPDTINNEMYLDAVEFQLDSLGRNNR